MRIADFLKLYKPYLKPLTRFYLLIVLVWFVLLAILITFILSNDISKAEQQFQRTADSMFEHLNNNVQTNESIIEGFASLLSSISINDRQRARLYAKRMLERYPHIYMFEIAEQVEKPELSKFIDYMRRNVYKNYRLGVFDFSKEREWKKLPDKPVYYPITFIEPMYDDAMSVLGLDLGSHQIFRQALQASSAKDIPVASPPFTMIEGQRGFLLHRGVDVSATEGKDKRNKYALLVIKAQTLLPLRLLDQGDLSVEVYNQQYHNNSGSGELFQKQSDRHSSIEEWLFPCLSYIREVDNPGQPFVLSLKRQLGFDDLNLLLLLSVLVIAGISYRMVLIFSNLHHHNEMQRLRYENRLYHLANNDSLTGLVNRNFLLDRMRQVLARAKRKQGRFAVVFMDMDNFKEVNDSFGHAAGDHLLKHIAERFKACMREEDTVCRYHGDEFVILLEEVASQEEIEHIKEKLHKCLSKPFFIEGNEVYAGVSIGVSQYPEDGETIEGLLHVADQYMYREKKG